MSKKKNLNKRLLNKEFKLVLESMLKRGNIFIKNTGIRIEITKLNHDKQYTSRKDQGLEKLKCEIRFVDPPTYMALTKCENYTISEESRPLSSSISTVKPEINARGYIKVMYLSNKPFDNKASNILFNKK